MTETHLALQMGMQLLSFITEAFYQLLFPDVTPAVWVTVFLNPVVPLVLVIKKKKKHNIFNLDPLCKIQQSSCVKGDDNNYGDGQWRLGHD